MSHVADHSASRGNGAKKPKLSLEEPARSKKCPVAGCTAEANRKHLMLCYVPGVFNLELSIEDITQRRLGTLKLCCRWL